MKLDARMGHRRFSYFLSIRRIITSLADIFLDEERKKENIFGEWWKNADATEGGVCLFCRYFFKSGIRRIG